MIDEKKLIRAMWDMYNNYYNDAVRFDEYTTYKAQKVLSDIQKIIEGLQPVGEWIPCNERLPNHPDQVLIIIKWNNYFSNDYEVTLGEYWGEEYGWGFENGEVLAWMPLTEAYKG